MVGFERPISTWPFLPCQAKQDFLAMNMHGCVVPSKSYRAAIAPLKTIKDFKETLVYIYIKQTAISN